MPQTEVRPRPVAINPVTPTSSQALLPSSPPIVSGVGNKVTAGLTWLGANAPTALAPVIASAAGTDIGGLGPECNIISLFINGWIQFFKQFHWFNQNKWAFPTAMILALGICFGIWHNELNRWALNFMATSIQPLLNYGPMNKLGIFGPGTDRIPKRRRTPRKKEEA